MTDAEVVAAEVADVGKLSIIIKWLQDLIYPSFSSLQQSKLYEKRVSKLSTSRQNVEIRIWLGGICLFYDALFAIVN